MMIIARHVLKESVRRRIFSVVLILTGLFVALFTAATVEAFNANSPFGGQQGRLPISQVTSVTLYGLGMFAVLFLALFTAATVEAFNAQSPFGGQQGRLPISQVTSVTLYGLGMFAVLFLATVLAVFLTLGAVRGDAESGLLQPLIVRPLGRHEFLLGRFAGALAVCIGYVVALYAIVLVIVHQAGGRWPGEIIGPGLALAGSVTVLVALSLLGSVFLSAAANGIAMFMLYGAGLVSGLLATIGHALSAPTVQTISNDLALALPFEALYQAGLHALGSNQSGLAGVLVNLGPFGSSHAGGIGLDVWAIAYIAGVGLLAMWAFGRRDL